MRTTESKIVKCIGLAKQKFFGGPGGDIPRFSKKPPGLVVSKANYNQN